MKKKSLHGLALLSTAALTLGVGASGTAQAVQAPVEGQQVITKNVPTPLSLAVEKDGSVYVSANFAGMLWHAQRGKKPELVFSKDNGAEVGAVSVGPNTVTFAITGKNKTLWHSQDGEKFRKFADVGAFESTKNPDQNVTYGVQGATPGCLAQWPTGDTALPSVYTGLVDSHPYGTYTTPRGAYVADAAGNDILWASNSGKVKLVALLPSVTLKITAEAAAANNLPNCAIGLDYVVEPVPTDVELGPDGWLYVSSLPGGPEDPSFGANGRVFKVNPATGKVKLVAKGLVSATNVAVAKNGNVFVTELFTGAIKRIKAGTKEAKPYLQLNMPAAVELFKGYLYATDNALIGIEPGQTPKGKVIRVPR